MVGLVPIGEGEPIAAPRNTERKIDYDRGVIIKLIRELGMEVFMYRDNPGVFLSQHGTEVSPALARKAGFDVDLLLRRRQHRELVAKATASYAKQLSIDATQATKVVIKEKDGFQVVLIGGSRYVLQSPDGDDLTKGMPLTKELALELLDEVAVSATTSEVLDGRDDGRGVGAAERDDAPRKATVKRG